jgi:PAS domain-containing protein
VQLDRGYIVTVVRDITERKRAEEVLSSPAKQRKSLFMELATILCISGVVFVCLYYSDPFEALVREYALRYLDKLDDLIEAQTIILAGLFVFLYRRWRGFQDRADQQIHVRKALETLHEELEMRVQQRTMELSNINDALQGEITERMRAEERLREQAAMLDLAHDAIIMHDFEDGRISFWSRGAETHYGWSVTEAMEMTIDDLFPMDSESAAETRSALLDAGEWRGEARQ